MFEAALASTLPVEAWVKIAVLLRTLNLKNCRRFMLWSFRLVVVELGFDGWENRIVRT